MSTQIASLLARLRGAPAAAPVLPQDEPQARPATSGAPAPDDAPWPVLDVSLPPREPHPDDLTIVDIASDPDAYLPGGAESYVDDSQGLAAAADREFALESQRVNSPGDRVCRALTGFSLGTVSAERVPCPVCEQDGPAGQLPGALGLALTRTEVRAQCCRGCASEDVASAIVERVVRAEAHERTEAKREDADGLAAKLSIKTLFGTSVPVRWVVPGHIPDTGLVIVGGTAGDGKTWHAMSLAMAVAAGKPWLGRTVERRRVLLMLLEGGAGDHVRRLGALARGLGVTPDSLDGWLDVYPMRGFRADDETEMAELTRTVATLGHKFVVIDNLTNARADTDENSAANMGHALKPLAALAATGIAILLLHHANAKGELRGSSAIRQHPDLVFDLKREGVSNDARIKITRLKDRFGTATEFLRYQIIDTKNANGEIVAVTPKNISFNPPRRVREGETDAGARIEAAAKRLAIPQAKSSTWSPRVRNLISSLPRASEALYRHMSAVHKSQRRMTQIARTQLERQGTIARNPESREWELTPAGIEALRVYLEENPE